MSMPQSTQWSDPSVRERKMTMFFYDFRRLGAATPHPDLEISPLCRGDEPGNQKSSFIVNVKNGNDAALATYAIFIAAIKDSGSHIPIWAVWRRVRTWLPPLNDSFSLVFAEFDAFMAALESLPSQDALRGVWSPS